MVRLWRCRECVVTSKSGHTYRLVRIHPRRTAKEKAIRIGAARAIDVLHQVKMKLWDAGHRDGSAEYRFVCERIRDMVKERDS